MSTRCALYLRVSLDATGEALAVDRQREDCRRIAAERGWDVVGEYVDNSVSASKREVRRPGYEALVAAYRAGGLDAIVCWDLDRLTRQPRQLEDWIDAAEDRGLRLVTANGEADLSTDAGRLFARIKAAVARAEIERKSARQKRAAVQRREAGKPSPGLAPFGFRVDGSHDPEAAPVVVELFDRLVAGSSLRELVARSGMPRSTVRTILTNARYAGWQVHRRKPTTIRGRWDPIVDEATFDLAQSILADPRRRTQGGTARKYLGSSLYLCGVCGHPLGSSGERYRCPKGCLVRRGAPIDETVRAAIRRRLERGDLAGLFRREVEAAPVVAEVKRLRARLAEIARNYDDELIDAHRFAVATEKTRARLTLAEREQARVLAGSGVAGLLAAPSPAEAFDRAPLGAQRAVLDLLAVVTLQKTTRADRGVPPGSVTIEPR